ncbi:hypothetical protein D6855_07600 [Butyrivibrio sp. CB08]|uniref:hypothetical protein n=1 Tax=Butyrivibrio sp. CB08 TaxID=2364879 RepID=UPI000EA87EA0|nr:hypothetical protein [Butyrivibrio sp. CB08]RKM60564.1 hypothetical protein D6855_07600 [Butyrivibrio sp. CB08]
MFFVVVLAVLLLSAMTTVRYKKNILDAVTVWTAALIMLLYVLAFFRAMKLVFVLAIIGILYAPIRAYLDNRSDVKQFKQEISGYFKALCSPYLILFVLTVIGVCVATADMAFTWWDDINFWSSDAKQFYFMNGFPGRYGNVSPEFGDYPPVTSIFKWLFLQISGKEYSESLQFAGYFCLNGVFLLPLLARIKDYIENAGFKKTVSYGLYLVSFLAVMLFPGVFNGIIYYGTPADVTMAIVYGALLLAIYDQQGHGNLFYFGRIGLYASILLLTKSIGFEWALFAFAFYILIGKRNKAVFGSALGAALSFGSWMGFCLVNRRVAKLTGAGVKMATSGNYVAPDDTADKLKFFFQGFAFEPMHSDHNLNIDLSTAAALVLIFVMIVVLYNMKLLGKQETKRIALFTLCTGLLAYGIVFLAHISIFQGEVQYMNSFAMGISIARYCAPFTLGMTYLLLGMMFNRLRARNLGLPSRILVYAVLLIIFLTADYTGVYKYLTGYHNSLAEDRAYVEDMVGDEGRKIAGAVADSGYYGKRVLVFRDGHDYYWVHNTYINKEASPVPLVYDSYLAEEDTADSIMSKIRASHAEYVYVEDETGESEDLFSQIIKNGEYEPGRVYNLAQDVY